MESMGDSSPQQKQLDVYDKMDLFFKDPHVPSEVPGEMSTLYLLRKDVWKCYGCNPDDCSETTRVLFPGAMTVFCGIDLLAKFYQSDEGRVGDRFKQYVEAFFPSGKEQDLPKHIYGLRNSMMHSFGMRAKRRATGEITYGIKVEDDCSQGFLVELKKDEWYVIDILDLREQFEASIEKFKRHVQRTTSLHETFSDMWDQYGSMFFSGVMLSTDEGEPNHPGFHYAGYSSEWEL